MESKITLRDYTFAALFAAVISILALISIPLPFSPVPITLQTLGIMLAGSLLTKRQAVMSISTYLLLGIIGVPVFAGGRAGISVLVGPSGGYLVGFLLGVITISYLKGSGNNIKRLGFANIVGGVVVVNIMGILWRMISTDISLIPAVSSVVLYIPGDLFKAFAATTVAFAINKQYSKVLVQRV